MSLPSPLDRVKGAIDRHGFGFVLGMLFMMMLELARAIWLRP